MKILYLGLACALLLGSAFCAARADQTFFDSSDLFEIVLVVAENHRGTHPIDAYVSDYASNAPISGAELTCEVSSSGDPKKSVALTPLEPGHYRANLANQMDSSTDLVLTLRYGEDADVFSFLSLQ